MLPSGVLEILYSISWMFYSIFLTFGGRVQICGHHNPRKYAVCIHYWHLAYNAELHKLPSPNDAGRPLCWSASLIRCLLDLPHTLPLDLAHTLPFTLTDSIASYY